VKNSSNLSTLSISRQPLPGYNQPSTADPNLAPNIQTPQTLSGVQWLDADDVSVVRPNAANPAAGGGSAEHGTLSGDETEVSLPAEKAAIGDNSLDGGGKRAAPGNVAAAGPLAIVHVDSGGNSAVDVGQPGGGGVDAALTQEDGFDVEERGAVDHPGNHLEESILLYTLLYHGYDIRRLIIWCSVSLFAEKTGGPLCSFSLLWHFERALKAYARINCRSLEMRVMHRN
jgi:hypothetical protein